MTQMLIKLVLAIRDEEGKWYSQMEAKWRVLMNYLLEMNKNIPSNGAVISTISFSTPMLDVIAKDRRGKSI